MSKKTVYATDPTYYTALYRQKGSRRYYRCGYRSINLEEMRNFVYAEFRAGKFATAKIVKWDTEEEIERVM